jgi:hypothetical protein
MSIADLTGWLKEAFEEALMSLQQDGKLYLTEEEWDARRMKRETENHSSSGARGSGAGKGCVHDQGLGRGDFSSSRSSNKPTGDKCWRCTKMGHWARECRSKPKKEQVCVTQDEDEGSLLVTATLTCPKASSMPASMAEAISSVAEIELKEETVYAHLDEEKERDAGI